MKTPPRCKFIVVCALALSLFPPAPPAKAAPGDLDPTFGAGGKVTTLFGSAASAQSVAVQSDGKIVVAGTATAIDGSSDFALVRYNADGSLDTAFGAGGRVTTHVDLYDQAFGAAVQNDGKIVVAGQLASDNFFSGVAVLRYTAAGVLDTSFNGTGIVNTGTSGRAGARGVAVQSDGKIVVAGWSATFGGSQNHSDFLVMRFTGSGLPDTEFNGFGATGTGFGNITHDYATCVAVQNDGKIVVAGYSSQNNSFNNDFAVARYTSNGAPDGTFNGSGKALTPIGSEQEEAHGVAVQSDGRIVVVGYSYNGLNDDIAAVRYTSGGALDLSFNGSGKVTTSIGTAPAFERSYGVAVQSDGAILVAGMFNGDMALLRYTNAGTLDPDFNGTGVTTAHFGNGNAAEGHSVAVQSDGKIVVAGQAGPGFADLEFALARFTDAGVPDASFNGSGIVTTPLGGSLDRGFSAAVQTDGRIVVAGYTARSSLGGTGSDFALARYNANGSPDKTFNGTGRVTTDVSGGWHDRAYSVAVQSDGKIVVAGSVFDDSDIAVLRYGRDGALDPEFNGTGIFIANLSTSSESARGVAIQSDGKIVVAGFSNAKIALLRLNPNGSLDTSFNGTGIVTTPVGGNSSAGCVAIQPDGKIVAAGQTFTGGNGDLALVRYNSDGSPDSTFNGTGTVTTAVGNSNEAAYAIAIQSDGRIVVTGYVSNSGFDDLLLVRYTSAGALDPDFGDGDGVVTAAIGNYAAGLGVAVQSNGRIVIAGYVLAEGFDDILLARYTAAGSLDSSFGGGSGIVTTAIGNSWDDATSVALQNDGRIVVAGYYGLTGSDFAVLRYEGDPPVLPAIGITGAGTAIPDGDAVPSTADGTDMGNAYVYAGAATHTFTIHNTGPGPLQLFAPTAVVSGPHAADFLVSVPPPTVVAAGGSAAFTISFDPRMTGLRSATITIFSNDSNKGSYDFGVQGTGILVPGDRDPAFNATGIVTTDLNTFDTGASVAVQSDDRIVVAGSAAHAGISDFAVARYTATGALDTSFNGTGKVITDLGSSEDAAQSVVVQSDGRIVVAGYFHNGSNYDFAVVRYTHTGALDTDFNGTGIVITPIGSGHDLAYSVALQPDGKIVVAGYSGADYALARFEADGRLDGTFSGDGKLTTNITGFDLARSVAVQSDGKIVAAGESDPPGGLTPAVFSLARYHADGSLDTSFNGTGRVTTFIGGMNSAAAGMAIQCDGRIIVAGSAVGEEGGGLALVRYTPAGALDTSFNGTGIVTGDAAAPGILASSVTLQADGKILVGGSSGLDFGLARFTGSGALEFSVTTNLATIGSGVSTQTSRDAGSSVAIQRDGKIVLAGSMEIPAGYSDFALVRYANDTPRRMFDNAAIAAGLTGTAADPAADPFHDGVDNLTKFAFNLNLAGPDARTLSPGGNAGLPAARFTDDGGQPSWQIEFVRRKGSGLIFTPLKSASLDANSFVPMTGPESVHSIDALFERVIVNEPLPAGTARYFSVVRVALP